MSDQTFQQRVQQAWPGASVHEVNGWAAILADDHGTTRILGWGKTVDEAWDCARRQMHSGTTHLWADFEEQNG